MNQQDTNRAERVDAVLLIQLHHLHAFELLVALSVFFYLGQLRLEFAHRADLMQLAFNQRQQSESDHNRKQNQSDTKVTTWNQAI